MQFKSFMEALRGKQQKIDKNKNGKIDASDFKLLQKEDREDRADYEVSKSGRKSHKQIVFPDGQPTVDNDKKEPVKEAKMSDADMAERERIVKGMKKNLASFKSKYGARGKDVMYATATKMAMKEELELDESSMGHLTPAERVKEIARRKAKIAANTTPASKAFVDKALRKEETVDEGMTRQDRERAATEQERRERTLRDNPRIAAEVARRQAAADAAKKPSVKEEVEELDEKSDQAKQNKIMKNMMDASRGARFKINNPQSMTPKPDTGHKTPRAHNVAIGRALRNEELDEKLTVVPSGGTNKVKKDEKTGVVSGTFDKSPPFDGPYSKPGKPGGSMNRARTLARQGMKQAMKEEFDLDITDEQADEIFEAVQKADIPAYLRKQKGDAPLKLSDLKRKDTLSDLENLKRHNSGVKEELDLEEQAPVAPVLDKKYIKGTPEHKAYKATKKPINGMPTGKYNEHVDFDQEGNLVAGKLSFSDFISKMNEHLLEYEAKDGVYKHKGSYGGNYVDPEGADDADDKKKPAPAEKRGRGRPAGAKSGARKITGTSKLFK